MNLYIYKYNKHAPITIIKYTSPKKNSYKKTKNTIKNDDHQNQKNTQKKIQLKTNMFINVNKINQLK